MVGRGLVLATTLAVAVCGPTSAALAAASPSPGAVAGPSVANPVVPGGTTFVANSFNNTVTEYSGGATGNATPLATISGSSTGLSQPQGALLGPSGDLFVANFSGNSITAFAPGASGNATPVVRISGSSTQLSGPEFLAFDGAGDLFVSNSLSGSVITEYAPGASGDATPIATLSGSNTKLNGPRGMVVSPAGQLIVANAGNSSITEYAPGASGNVAPTATISGSNTALNVPVGLVLGPTGDLIVANFQVDSITEYAPGANGNVVSKAFIRGAHTGLKSPIGVAVGPTGDLLVSNTNDKSVTEYARGATGDATPVATLSGTNTGLDGPAGIAVAEGEPYHRLFPARITDTRSGSVEPNAGHTLGPGGTLDVQVTGAGGVPAGGVAAVVLNVTATNPTRQSFLTVWPTGAPRPTASSLNFGPGQTVPNLVEVGLGDSGKVTIFNPTGSVDAVVDVEGYTGAATAGVGLFNSLTPARITDTRAGSGFPNAGHTLGPGSTLDVQVTGAGGVPATGVAAVVLNVTATNPTALSFLTVWPKGPIRPNASNVNFVPGQTVPNRVMVPVGIGGRVSIFNAAGSVDVVVDVGGWFTDASSASATGAQFTPTTPVRITDTRAGSRLPNAGHTLGPGGTLEVQARGVAGVPIDAVADVVNATTTDTTAMSFLTLFPNGSSRPTASDLNWVAGKTVANLAVVEPGHNSSVTVFNAAGSVDVIVDVSGWYS